MPCAAPQRPKYKDQSTQTYSFNLHLSLVHRLVGGLDHPGPGAKLKEFDRPKGLGEQIRKLVIGVDVARLDAPVLQTGQPRMKWYLTWMCLLRS